jgi:hypothetical protein
MATPRRVFYTQPLPADAEVVTRQHRGKPRQFVRLVEGGRAVFYPLTKSGNGYVKPAAKWYGQYTDAGGVQRRVPLSENKAAAQQMLNELLRRVEMEKAGIRDPFQDHRKTPLESHLADWEASLIAKENSESYVALKLSRVRRVLSGCRFAFIDDLAADRVEAFVSGLREAEGISIQTANFYYQAIKQFCAWMRKNRRCGDNPMEPLVMGNVRTDRRHDRRELSAEQLTALLKTAFTSDRVIRRLTGRDRGFL